MLDLQRIGLKIFADPPAQLSLNPFLAIFGRWRAEASHPAQWVDLADYAHMPQGPGIMLIGKLANFSFDLAQPGPGALYVSKKDLSGSYEDRLRRVMREGFELAARLAAEAEFPTGVRLKRQQLELFFNDRLETPNTDATDGELGPAVGRVFEEYEITREPDAGRRYGFLIRGRV